MVARCQMSKNMAVGAGSATWQHYAPLGTGAGTQPWQERATGWNEDTAWHSAGPWQQAQAVCLSAPMIPCPAQAHCRPRVLAPGNPGSGAVGQLGSVLRPRIGPSQVDE